MSNISIPNYFASPSRSSFSRFFEIAILFSISYEIIIVPILAVLDIGLGFAVNSNFLVRFGYILLFSLGLFVFVCFRSISSRYLFFSTFFLLLIGLTVSFFDPDTVVTSKIWSHIYFLLMPFFVVPVGYKYGELFYSNRFVRKRFLRLCYLGAVICLCVVVGFRVFHFFGLAVYNAIGLSSILILGPFFYVHSRRGFFAFLVVLFVSVLAAKSTVLFASLVAGVTYFLMIGTIRARLFIFVVFFVFGVSVAYFYTTYGLQHRSLVALMSLFDGDYDAFSSGRWSELLSLFSSFTTVGDWIFGMGYGYTFVPWDDSPGYVSHYVHFGNFTWLLMNGVLGYVVIFSFLLHVLYLNFKIIASSNDSTCKAVAVSVVSFFILSLFGAVLMTSTIIWFLIGWSLFNSRNFDS